MQITLNLPDDLAQLDQTVIMQAIVIALFQQERITLDQGAQLIGISSSDFQQLLTRHNISVDQAIVPDPDDEPEALVLESLRTSLQHIREGRVHPISELWDGIGDRAYTSKALPD